MVVEPSSPENPQPSRQGLQKAAIVSGILLGMYVLIYCGLSGCGAYAPACWGLRSDPTAKGQYLLRPKFYEWDPLLFYSPATGESRKWLEYFYLPLMIADRRLWHDHSHLYADDPRHPEVFPIESFNSQATERTKSKAAAKPAP